MAYNGYYIKIGANKFDNPLPARENYKVKEDLETDMDSQVNAAGDLTRNILPTKRNEINIVFPPMSLTNWRIYIASLNNDYLTVEFYSYKNDGYRTATFYMPPVEHNTLFMQPSGERIMQPLEITLISYGNAS